MTTQPTIGYITVPGRRLRWTMATLAEAGVTIRTVTRDRSGAYRLIVDHADEPAALAALEPIRTYQRRRRAARRQPAEIRATNAILAFGLAATVPAGLVAPAAIPIMLGMLAIFRIGFPRMAEAGRTMAEAGGRYRLIAIVGAGGVLIFTAAVIATVGALSIEQIAAGNSALKLLQ